MSSLFLYTLMKKRFTSILDYEDHAIAIPNFISLSDGALSDGASF
jgi:hypothetical protein